MSSISAPFGFRASYHNSGQMRPKAYVIASTYAANIFSGDPVKLTDNGVIQLGTSDGTRSGTTDGVSLLGILDGFATTQLGIARIEVNRMTTQLVNSGLK
jgi:hypothetical protein